MTQRLLVVRFPDGSWSHGGKENDPDYAECEKFWITSDKSARLDPKGAIKVAQRRRQSALMKQRRLEEQGKQA